MLCGPSSCSPTMAERGRSGTALPDEKVLALAWVYLVALALSLLGSGSIVAASLLRRRCCQEQLCPLFLLSLADLLGASALLSAAAIQLLPQRLFVSAYQACPYLLMLGLMFYAISLLVVVVYAYEVKRTLGGWREAPSSALLEEESGRFNERLQTNLPRLLAWLLPFLVFVVLLVMRGSSLRDVAPWTIPPVALQAGNRSQGSYGLYCSSCLVLIHHSQDTCYKYTGRKDSGKEGKIFFLVFISLVVFCCTVLYCRVKCWCRRRQRGGPPLNLPAPESDGCAGRTRTTRSACFFQLVFLVCWMPAFSLCLLSFTSLQPTSLFPLYVAMALTISLQGFLHSLVYGWLRQNFRREVTGEQMPLLGHLDQKAFYEDSLAICREG
ncbi:uncharacterized protein LOC118090886 isoform X2 [Zootoca vivipara]|uniref:uncharacterized protein LOC118090886 isoform X2 n=1 Tax=Zootoca vivipara TaxID=8524 RepID=UPI00293B8745|nr:uncharacterized protein LOC118090886 isoform X2 [Zootoca vivipara]